MAVAGTGVVAAGMAAADITDRRPSDRMQRRGWLQWGRPLRLSDRAVLPTIAGLGLALRLVAVLRQRPLWLDEAMLARPIVDRPLVALLTTPLPDGQVAPVGFLALERLAVTALGTSETALRVVPLIASLLAIPLGIALARRIVPARAVPLAALLLAVARPLVLYAAQAKPYASDVAVTLALTLAWLETRARGARPRAVAALAALAAIAVWLSTPAILVLLGLAAATAVVDRHAAARGARRRLAVGALLWGPSGAVATWVAWHRVGDGDRLYLHRFWSTGFWQWPPDSLREAFWPLVAPASALDRLLVAPPGLIWLALVVGGLLAARAEARFRGATALLAGPAIACGVAAAAGAYPFADRLVLFLLPGALLLAAGAVARVGVASPPVATLLGGVLVIAQLAGTIALPTHEDVRSLEHAVEARRLPTDAVYVYYGAGAAYAYYHGRERRTTAFDIGGCHRTDWRGYLREVDRYAGRPVWLVVAHSFDAAGVREDSALTAYLASRRRATVTIGADGGFARRYAAEDRSGVPADLAPVPQGAVTVRRPSAGPLACRDPGGGDQASAG